MRLKDKIVLITGSTTGIGKAIAKKCVDEGARVVVHGRDESSGEEVVNSLGQHKAILILDDLADTDCAKRIIQKTLNHYGKLDSIINNAAYVATSNIDSTDASLLDDVFRVNTFTPFLLIREGLKELAKTRGSVLNIGSVNAWAGEPNLLA